MKDLYRYKVFRVVKFSVLFWKYFIMTYFIRVIKWLVNMGLRVTVIDFRCDFFMNSYAILVKNFIYEFSFWIMFVMFSFYFLFLNFLSSVWHCHFECFQCYLYILVKRFCYEFSRKFRSLGICESAMLGDLYFYTLLRSVQQRADAKTTW